MSTVDPLTGAPIAAADEARHARQLRVPGHGPAALAALRAARVQVVGAGEVGGPALYYLAAAGVGTLLVDDALDAAPEDAGAWLYPPEAAGQARTLAALAALRAVDGGLRARPWASAAAPTAVLVTGGPVGPAREAAERARAAGLPHVVALCDGDLGSVVSIPVGAPCYACASRPGVGRPPRPGVAAAVGALAAAELLALLIPGPAPAGRRIDVVAGLPRARPTAAVPGCSCTRGRA